VPRRNFSVGFVEDAGTVGAKKAKEAKSEAKEAKG